jgi:hypothetical protein
MKGRLAVLGIAAALVLAALVPSYAGATRSTALAVRSESATYHRSTGLVTFRITFNRAPDFATTDDLGRQADEFQYFVGSDEPEAPWLYDSVIRGAEIHSSGLVRVRNNALVPDPAPEAGGWGTVRGDASFDLRGPVLRFSAPLSVVTDRTDLDALPYMLETYQFGEQTSHTVDSIVVQR